MARFATRGCDSHSRNPGGTYVVDTADKIGQRSRIVREYGSFAEARSIAVDMNRLDDAAWRGFNRTDLPARIYRKIAERRAA